MSRLHDLFDLASGNAVYGELIISPLTVSFLQLGCGNCLYQPGYFALGIEQMEPVFSSEEFQPIFLVFAG